VGQILKHGGIDPALRRSEVTRTQFLRSHAAIARDVADADPSDLADLRSP